MNNCVIIALVLLLILLLIFNASNSEPYDTISPRSDNVLLNNTYYEWSPYSSNVYSNYLKEYPYTYLQEPHYGRVPDEEDNMF